MPATDTFFCIGVSYKKADAALRGRFSITSKAIPFLLEDVKNKGISSLVLSSTCNRTELYAQAPNHQMLVELLCQHSEGTTEDFKKAGNTYEGADAISHLFRVGTGLDSQILGDFEIISQLKKSFKISKKVDLLSPYICLLYTSDAADE